MFVRQFRFRESSWNWKQEDKCDIRAILLFHKRATSRIDVTVMTRTRIYEKYHNVGWRNKKLALYQILLSSSTAVDRRSCTVARRQMRGHQSWLDANDVKNVQGWIFPGWIIASVGHTGNGRRFAPPSETRFATSRASEAPAGSASIRERRALYLRSISVGCKDPRISRSV